MNQLAIANPSAEIQAAPVFSQEDMIRDIYYHIEVMNSEQGMQATEIAKMSTQLTMVNNLVIGVFASVMIAVLTNVVLGYLNHKKKC